MPTHVLLPQSTGLDSESLALVEQIRTIDRTRLTGYIGRIGGKEQAEIDSALLVCVGIENLRSPKGEMMTLETGSVNPLRQDCQSKATKNALMICCVTQGKRMKPI